jgi:hypothetical protein
MINPATKEKGPIRGVRIFGCDAAIRLRTQARETFGNVDGRMLTQRFRNVLIKFFNRIEPNGSSILLSAEVWGARSWMTIPLFVVPSSFFFVVAFASCSAYSSRSWIFQDRFIRHFDPDHPAVAVWIVIEVWISGSISFFREPCCHRARHRRKRDDLDGPAYL